MNPGQRWPEGFASQSRSRVSMVQYRPSPIASLAGCGVMARRCFDIDFASRSSSVASANVTNSRGRNAALAPEPARIVSGRQVFVKPQQSLKWPLEACRQETRRVGPGVGLSRRNGRRPLAANYEVLLFRQASIFTQPAERVSWPQAPRGAFIRRMVDIVAALCCKTS